MKNKNAKSESKKVEATPSWAYVLPILLLSIEIGSGEGKLLAKEELMRMATLADSLKSALFFLRELVARVGDFEEVLSQLGCESDEDGGYDVEGLSIVTEKAEEFLSKFTRGGKSV